MIALVVAGMFLCLILGLVLGVVLCKEEMDEEWCGCDGEGMTHKPGAESFLCAKVVVDIRDECRPCPTCDRYPCHCDLLGVSPGLREPRCMALLKHGVQPAPSFKVCTYLDGHDGAHSWEAK